MLALLAYLHGVLTDPSSRQGRNLPEGIDLAGYLGLLIGAIVGFHLGAVYGQRRAYEVLDTHD